MPKAYTTIAQASVPPRRPNETSKKPAPLTTEQQKEKRDARQEKQSQIDAAVQEWMEYTNELANKLAKRFDMKARYFLDIFSQGGAHMIHHQENTNPYNAFKSVKAAEAREQGTAMTGGDLHKAHYPEYQALTKDERDTLVEEFDKTKQRNFHLRRDTPRARVQDVSNVVRNMKMLLFGAGQRVGLEGFFCIVRNNVDFKMDPEWYFTSKELEGYMEVVTRKKWSTSEVGMKLEAFAIAGCDAANMLRTSAQKINFMKGEIRALLLKNLVDVSKVSDARLAWKWFEEDVVQRYGVVLEGWTTERIMDPSLLSTSVTVIRKLLDAVKTGECAFRKLSREEAADRLKKWEEEVSAGKVIAKHRAPRCDAGQRGKNSDGENDDGNDDPAPTPPPQAKRVRKSAKAAAAPAASTTLPASRRKPGTGTKILAALSKRANVPQNARNDATTAAALQKLKASRTTRKTQKHISAETIDDSGDDENMSPHSNGGNEGAASDSASGSALVLFNPYLQSH
ncbi:hypothetical protein R3P38DRAFT_2542991 [Favolaschia claudopus]|uniref:Uncharacterized protein n=1 Tax=Favolaschia claudopus TaxID=2862362 RepID=A0AAW0ARK8_9AGAR